jgi:hypothetical protein
MSLCINVKGLDWQVFNELYSGLHHAQSNSECQLDIFRRLIYFEPPN